MKEDFFARSITEDVSDWTCSGLRKRTVGEGIGNLIAESMSATSRAGASVYIPSGLEIHGLELIRTAIMEDVCRR